MVDTARALREASDALLRDLEALFVLEEEKRAVQPGDPRLVDLAAQIEVVAGRLLRTSSRERALTEQIQQAAEAGDAPVPVSPIDATPRAISSIIADWRVAERRLEAAEDGTAEAREAEIMVDQLREEYRKAHEAARGRKPG